MNARGDHNIIGNKPNIKMNIIFSLSCSLDFIQIHKVISEYVHTQHTHRKGGGGHKNRCEIKRSDIERLSGTRKEPKSRRRG